MGDVDAAIERAGEFSWRNASSGEVRQAYSDRSLLAEEVVRLRELLDNATKMLDAAIERAEKEGQATFWATRRLMAGDVHQIMADRVLLAEEVVRLRDDIELLRRYGKTADELADEAEKGYDVSKMRPNQRQVAPNLGEPSR